MDTSTVTREEIMKGVLDLHRTMGKVVFWSEVMSALIVGATILVVSLILYQMVLKRREGIAIRGVLVDVKQYLQIAQDHAKLTDAQKRSIIAQVSEAVSAARVQASKVELAAKVSAAEVMTKLDTVPERTADRVAEKLSTGDSHHGQVATPDAARKATL